MMPITLDIQNPKSKFITVWSNIQSFPLVHWKINLCTQIYPLQKKLRQLPSRLNIEKNLRKEKRIQSHYTLSTGQPKKWRRINRTINRSSYKNHSAATSPISTVAWKKMTREKKLHNLSYETPLCSKMRLISLKRARESENDELVQRKKKRSSRINARE